MVETMLKVAPVLPIAAPQPFLEVRDLSVLSERRPLLRDVSLRIEERQVFGIIGPSGAGKSTLLRCLNRLIELTPNLRLSGDVLLDGRSIYRTTTPVDRIRVEVGMLFQQPVVFPKSVYQNVLFGVRHLGNVPRREWPEVVERVLRQVALWREVADRLHEPAGSLSIGQQQRLCLARLLAVKPRVILMDEPTSALDPVSTEAVEELIRTLKQQHTIVLVSHNMGQVRRLADFLACVCIREGAGEVVESACCDAVFESSQCHEVVQFLSNFR
jgi:phosphate transport system ATP-binding protein